MDNNQPDNQANQVRQAHGQYPTQMIPNQQFAAVYPSMNPQQQVSGMAPTYMVSAQPQQQYQNQPAHQQPIVAPSQQYQSLNVQSQVPPQAIYMQPHIHQQPYMLDQRQVNLQKAQKSVKRWSKCQMYTGYLWVVANGISLATNVFMILSLSSWTEIPFFDMNGDMHKVKLPGGGLFFLAVLKIIANYLFIKWGLEAVKTFKPIVKEVEREEISGVSHQPKEVSNLETINAHKKNVFKILMWVFGIFTISLLYGRSYFNDVAMKFIDDEYDGYERRNQTTGNYTQPTYNNWESVNSTNDTVVFVSSFIAGAPPQQWNTIQMQAPPRFESMPYHPSMEGEGEKPEHHKRRVEGNGPFSRLTKKHHFRGFRGRGEDDFSIEDWDFSKTPREDAKLMARAFITTVAIAIFAYGTIIYAIFSAIVMCLLNRTRKVTMFHEECQNTFRPNHHHYHNQHHNGQPSMAAGIIHREANGLGYERAPLSEPAEEVSARQNNIGYSTSINSAPPSHMVIPRGVVIN